MSKTEKEPKKIGGIDVLDSSSVYPNYAQNFVEARKFGRNDVVFFNLGVKAEDLKTVYGREPVDKLKYDQIPRYYKDGENVREYNNGKEIKDECSKIVNILTNLQNNYGNKSFSSSVREDLNKRIGAEMTALGRLLNAEDYPENLSKARMTSAAKANRDMQSHLLDLQSDANLPENFKKQIESSLNLIRESQNPNIPLEKLREAAGADLIHPDRTPGQAEEYDKKIRKELEVLLKSAAEKNISNSNIKDLIAIQNEDANLRMSVSTDYSKVLSLTKQSVARLEEISQQMSQLTPLAYSGAIVQIKASKPSKEEMAKAYTQLLIEQEAITGISPSDKDFHSKVKLLNPKTLGKLEVSFQSNPPDDKVQLYTVNNEKLVKALRKIDKPTILEPSKNLTLKTDSRTIPDYSINSNTLLQQLKAIDLVKYGKITSDDLQNVTVELKVKKPGANIKSEQEKTPMEKASDENLKALNDSSTSKDAFKNAMGARPENIESAKLVYLDKSGARQEVSLTLSQLGQLKDRTSVKSAPGIRFFDLSTKEKAMMLDNLGKIVGKHPEKVMKQERDNSKRASQPPIIVSSLQTAGQVSAEKIVQQAAPPNLVFPAEALEAFHNAKLQSMSVNEKAAQLGKKDFTIDIPKTAASTLTPTPLSKADEELKQKLQTRPVITQEGLTAKPALKTMPVQTSRPELATSSDEKTKPATKVFEPNNPRVSTFAQIQAALSKRDEELKKKLQKHVDSTQTDIPTKPGMKPQPSIPQPKAQFAPRTVEGPLTKSGMKPLPPLPDNVLATEPTKKTPPPVPPKPDKLKNVTVTSSSATLPVENPTTSATIQTSRPELKGKPLPPIPPELALILKVDGMTEKTFESKKPPITPNSRIKIGMRGKKDDTPTH